MRTLCLLAAAAMLKKMTVEEKVTMLHGGTSPGQARYVGNTPTNKRLGIPALNLNDGPQGFRSGGTTCWPSGLTVATTWDMEAMGACVSRCSWTWAAPDMLRCAQVGDRDGGGVLRQGR